jgi:MFS family permease
VRDSPWAPFRYPVYSFLWVATVAANIGGWMYNAAAGWLMITLNADPLVVSLVQAASSLPMFLLAMPAGALADTVDRRRFILTLELFVCAVSVAFASLVSAALVSPVILLLCMFLISCFSALEAPAWQAIVPQLVPRKVLGSAIAANSVGVNISRAIGPALAGIMIAGFGIAAPFWLDAFSNIGVIGVFIWWRSRETQHRMLPAERFLSAIRAGFRYARNNAHLRSTLARSMGFFLFASAYWALLPLLVHNQIAAGPELYGVLLGSIGAGAVACAFVLPWLKRKLGADALAAIGEVGTALALVLFGLAREPIAATCASVVSGASWIAVIANLNVSAQMALPDWVRGRGLALYSTVFFGSMTVGSVFWGAVAGRAGLPLTYILAATGAIVAIPLTSRWKLQTAAHIDLRPSMNWPEPVVTDNVEYDVGPVMVTIEYRIAPSDRKAFLLAIQKMSRERKRDGAYAWGVFQDTADDGRYIETFLVESWIEHLRQHERVTNADHGLQEAVFKFQTSGSPKVTHLFAADPGDAPEIEKPH